MVLAGSINKQIVGLDLGPGGKAIGLCGKDGNMVRAKKVVRAPSSILIRRSRRSFDLGFVGEPDQVDRNVLDAVLKAELIPVLAPVAVGENAPNLQRQRRHLRRRHRRSHACQAPAAC